MEKQDKDLETMTGRDRSTVGAGELAGEIAALIADYCDAYRAVNTMTEPPSITYADGWFTFKQPFRYPGKYRRHAVISMLGVLRDRAADIKGA